VSSSAGGSALDSETRPMISLFSKKKEFKVRGLVLKLLNNNCSALKAQINEARDDSRVNLAIVVAVIPLKDGRLRLDEAFTTVTKDFSINGLSIVLHGPLGFDQVILGFRVSGEMVFVRAEAKHINPMGAEFFQLGLQLLEVVSTGEYPELESISV
jgi:hypothetical protein